MPKKVYQENLEAFSNIKINNSVSGKNLIQAFHNLGINKASINKLQIEGWFDTECEATLEMLEWFSQYIDENNALTSYENYRYKELKESNEILSDREYDVALSNLMQKNAGILDYDDNCFEITYLEEELDMVSHTKQRLDQIVTLHKKLSAKLAKGLNELKEEEIAIRLQKNEAIEKCSQLSMELDENHRKLQVQMNQFVHQINQCDNTETNFITQFYLANSEGFHKVPSLDLFLKREFDSFPKLNSTTKSARKRLLHDKRFDFANELEVMRNRITKSIQRLIEIEAINEATKLELNFLQNLNVHNFERSYKYMDQSCQVSMESNIISQDMIVQNSFNVIEKLALAAGEAFINKPKIRTLHNSTKIKQQKLDRIKSAHSKVMHIKANYVLLNLLLNNEINYFQTTDSFFKNLHYYITTVLHNCRLRIGEMQKIISDYSLHQKLPLEERFEIFRYQRKILLDDLNDLTSLEDLIRNFNNEYQKTEQQIFVNDYSDHRITTKKLEMYISSVRKTMSNGLTSQIVIIPIDLFKCFAEINNIINSQAVSIKQSLQLFNDAGVKLSKSKWFKIRRQLWMWFLADPKKLFAAIEQIELAAQHVLNKK